MSGDLLTGEASCVHMERIGSTRRTWGTPLPEELHQRLLRECERLALAEQQFAALEKTCRAQLPEPARERIDQLTRLSGIGPFSGSRLAMELFWRQFVNRRQVGA